MEQQLLFPCGRGHEQPLALELEHLGLRDIKIGHAVVSGRGSLELAYRGCLWLRTASRVLLPLADGEVNDPDDIYALVKSIAWEDHLDPNCTFAVFFNGTGQGIRNTQFGALKCKDAIADRLLERYRRRPDVDNKEPDISIDVHLRRGQLTVSLDLSGGGLHRRGYRHSQGAAPIKENLAAAMLYRCQWPELSRQGFNLIDLLCGSGTLLLEGLQMAADIAPALGRERFGFSAWLPHKPSQWRQLIEEAQQRREEGLNRLELKIWGFDQDREAIFAAKENARRLGLGHCLHLEVSPLDRFAWVKAYGEQGLIISNPPYGERLGSTIELIPTYEGLGAAFKGFPAGWQLALVSSNAALLQRLHLKSHRHYQAQNGSLDVSINLYRRDEQREEVGTNPAPPSGFGGGEVVVHHQIVEQARLLDFVARFGQPHGNHLRGVGGALVQALLQSGQGRRGDEDAVGLRQLAADLLRTLGVDFEDNVDALAGEAFQALGAGAVVVAVHFGVFHELPFFYHALEFGHADEVVVFAVFLAAARGAGGVGNGHADVGMVLQQPGDQRGFACAGGGGNNENIALHDAGNLGGSSGLLSHSAQGFERAAAKAGHFAGTRFSGSLYSGGLPENQKSPRFCFCGKRGKITLSKSGIAS